jgi:hypothetical protein
MPNIAKGRWNSASATIGDSPRTPKGVDTVRLDAMWQHGMTTAQGDGTQIDSERVGRVRKAADLGVAPQPADLVTGATVTSQASSSTFTTGGTRTSTRTILDTMPESVLLSEAKYGGETVIPEDETARILLARYSAPTGYTYTPPKTTTAPRVVYNPIVRPPGSRGGPQEGW